MQNIDIFKNVEDAFNTGADNIEQIKQRGKQKRRSSAGEADYLKVYKYTNTLFAFKGIPLSYVPFVVEIGRYMSYADDGQLVILNKFIKDKIAETLDVKLDRVNKVIKELKDFDVLRPTGSRGVFAVNPFVISCGDSVHVEELKAQFDFDADLMIQKNVTHNLITGKVVQSVIREKKDKQIPGQQSLFDQKYLGESEDTETKPQKQQKPKKKPQKNRFNDYQQNDYDTDELERILTGESRKE